MTTIDSGIHNGRAYGHCEPAKRSRTRMGPSGVSRILAAAIRGSAHAARTLITSAEQVGLLWAIFGVSNVVVTRLHLRVPANIVGMLLLFALLCSGIVEEQWISRAAGALNRHLAFFFIPVAV